MDPAEELKLYIVNDGRLYRERRLPLEKTLIMERARGIYRHDRAVQAFLQLVERGAKQYVVEFGGSVNRSFPVTVREEVAEALARDFESEASFGEFDYLLGPAESAKSPAELEHDVANFLAAAGRQGRQGRRDRARDVRGRAAAPARVLRRAR